MKLFVLISMVFMHVLADYNLQGILASLKQKEWWSENAPDKKYRFDYIAGLLMHSVSWSFLILLPIAVFCRFNVGLAFSLVFVFNTAIHAFVDNLKANKKSINLLEDQLLHAMQIVASWTVFVVIHHK